MSQPKSQQPVTVREMLWTYRSANAEAQEKDFYPKLADDVSQAISSRLREGERVWVGREMRLRLEAYTLHARLINIEPPLATVVGQPGRSTYVFSRFQERSKDERQDASAFIAEIIRYPNEQQSQVYHSLVGLEAIQSDLYRKLALLLQPAYLRNWAQRVYENAPPTTLLQIVDDRYPLTILEGQVGSGKTALARSIGSELATHMHTELALVVMNAQVRGGGYVGDLTRNIARAFAEATQLQENEQMPVMLLIDEADALAQARGGRQTHHEDDAGVNALIQCIDQLRGKPMAVIFATNLAQNLDAAIMRRAVAVYHFDRPSTEQRADVFRRALQGLGFSEQGIHTLAEATKPRALPGFGSTMHRYTYSDLTQRIIPTAIEYALWAKPAPPLSIDMLVRAAQAISPTPEAHTESQR
ncbi:MAG TPA: ATP-binding protein [Ktedonobacterales bacterium]|nr:ATP-binding protein [Ktedonobacterales bacterium]